MKVEIIEGIKNLRMKTGAGFLDCKKALQENNQDFDKAIEWLKKKGLAKASKKTARKAEQGKVASYIHGEGRIGVLVEVNVETDFAARGEIFQSFVHDLCLHIVAMDPLFIEAKDVSEERRKKEESIFKEQALQSGKKSSILEKVVTGMMNKWLSEVCLLQQVFLKNASSEKKQTVEEMLKNLIVQLGENIVIRRFVRFELGETAELSTGNTEGSSIGDCN